MIEVRGTPTLTAIADVTGETGTVIVRFTSTHDDELLVEEMDVEVFRELALKVEETAAVKRILDSA